MVFPAGTKKCGIFRTVVEVTHALLVFALVCTVLNVVAAVVLARLSLPMRLRKWRERADTHIDELTVVVDDINKRSKLWDSTINGLIEEAGDAFGRAERKRASLASKESRSRDSAQPVDLGAMNRRDRLDYQRARIGTRS